MFHNGAAPVRRMLAFFLTLAVMMTACLPTALAEDFRGQMMLNLLWVDADNNVQTTPALPMQTGEQTAFWAQMDASALGSSLTLQVSGVDPAYFFYILNDGGIPTDAFIWEEENPDSPYLVYHAVYDQHVDDPILLYISTSPMPEEDATPEFTPFPVDVEVFYVTEEGDLLDQQWVACWTGETTRIVASSNMTEGYTLLSDGVVDVYVNEQGEPDTGDVVFTYAKIATPTPAPTAYPVNVTVYYVTDEGDLLDQQVVSCWSGESTPVWASSAYTEGYELISMDTVEVRVDENGVADPGEVVFTYAKIATPTPEPTEEPTPTPIPEAVLVVYYEHVDGSLLDMQEVTLGPGSYLVQPGSDKVAGLILDSEPAVEVTVDEYGNASVPSVRFVYKEEEKAPAEATITVNYIHVDGTLIDSQSIRLSEGEHSVVPASGKALEYIPVGNTSAQVAVDADGMAHPDTVEFYYESLYVAPAEATIMVNYIHVDGTLIDSQSIRLSEGEHSVVPASGKALEYIPVGNTSAQVAVDADGVAHPDTVEFYYESPYVAPVTAQLTVLYQTQEGMPISQEVVELTPGAHTLEPDTALLKTMGYAPVGEQAQLVYVTEDGQADPTSVVFTFRNVTVKIPVRYQDDRERDVAPEQEVTFVEDGEYTIQATPAGLPDNYELAPGQSGQVQVSVVNGVPSKNAVYFYYRQKSTGPVMADVTVCYYDPYGEEIAPSQTITLAPGIHQVNANSAETFRGYVLVSEPSITVEVYENGTFSPQEVAFYYRFAEDQKEEKTAPVTILYRDDRGNDVAPAQTLELGEGDHTIEALPVEGYTVFEGTDSQVTVSVRDGVASRSQVVFYYQKTQTTPTVFTIPVNYYDTMGEMIATTQYVQVAAGTYAIQANPSDLPEGYELMMDPVLTVRVNRDGTTDPEEIAFYYRAPEKKATIMVFYVNEEGKNIAEPFAVELSAGYHTMEVDIRRVPEGFDPDSAQPVKIFVSREGVAEPAQAVFTFERLILETPIPVGEYVYRYAKVDSNSVAFRSEPSTSGGNKTVIKRLGRSDRVYVLQEMYNDEGEVWAMINVDGRIGYMMSEFIQVMSQEESDAYAGRSTPVPTFTPAPTATPYRTATPTLEPLPTPTATIPYVEAITAPPTATPTEAPTPTATPTASPTPTATPAPYQGYALTTRATALRTGISASDMTIMHDMEANTLVRVVNQIPDPATGEMWSIISTMSQQAGFVQDSALRYITDREAQPYLELWEEMNREPEPTKLITPTPEPMQVEGYGIVLGDGVPFRQMQSEFSRIIDNLEAGTMVYISGQTAGEGQYWHSVNYEGRWGYIRTDLVRMLTIAEEEEYLESLMASPTPATTNIPFDEEGLSSYGYVDGSNVNWREGPSTGERKVGELRRYAFCLVLGTEYVNGVTWYHVKYGEETGYIHGDFFKQMTISELEDFLGSEEYLQGVVNNSPDGQEALDNVGFTGTGGLISAEDQWVHDNNDLIQNTMNPWQPIATVPPIQTTPTLEPLPSWTTAAPTATPSPTPTFNPLPDVTYPTANTGSGGSAVVWVFVLGLLLLAVGGVFALVRHQQNKRRIALRAAQRRAQAARAQQQQQRPYARTAAPGQPRTGTYPGPQAQVRQQADNQPTSTYTPYARPAWQDDIYAPAEETTPVAETTPADGTTQRNPRVGRRTAYRQAQENNQSEGNTFDM